MKKCIAGLLLLAFAFPSFAEDDQHTVWYCTTEDMAVWFDDDIRRVKTHQERFIVKTKIKSVELGEPFNEKLSCTGPVCDTDCCNVSASNAFTHFNFTRKSMTFNLVSLPDSVRVGSCETF